MQDGEVAGVHVNVTGAEPLSKNTVVGADTANVHEHPAVIDTLVVHELISTRDGIVPLYHSRVHVYVPSVTPVTAEDIFATPPMTFAVPVKVGIPLTRGALDPGHDHFQDIVVGHVLPEIWS